MISDDDVRAIAEQGVCADVDTAQEMAVGLLEARARIAALEAAAAASAAGAAAERAARERQLNPRKLEVDLVDLDEYARRGDVRGVRAVACRIALRPCWCGMHITTFAGDTNV